MPTDLPWVALLAVLIAGPWGVVLIVALARGYSITVTLVRPDGRRRRWRRPRELDDDDSATR